MAGKARVHELAKELGVTSKQVLARLSEQGEFVKSASSTVEAPVARRLRESFGGSKPSAEPVNSGGNGSPKPAAPRKGPSQSPAQQAKRAEGQRRYQDGQRAARGAPDKAHRGEGGDAAKKPARRRRRGGSVGAHKGAVQRTGAPR